jgi:hypothetical protein
MTKMVLKRLTTEAGAEEAPVAEAAEAAEKAAFYAHTEAHLLAQAMADEIICTEWDLADGNVPRDPRLRAELGLQSDPRETAADVDSQKTHQPSRSWKRFTELDFYSKLD